MRPSVLGLAGTLCAQSSAAQQGTRAISQTMELPQCCLELRAECAAARRAAAHLSVQVAREVVGHQVVVTACNSKGTHKRRTSHSHISSLANTQGLWRCGLQRCAQAEAALNLGQC
jgi:hypothetical protein